MNFVHENFVHLGPLTHTPVLEYMARTLTALYAFHGAVIVRLSFDVPRYRPVVKFVGCLQVLLGLAAFAIDFAAGLPWFWAIGEGMGLTGGGLAGSRGIGRDWDFYGREKESGACLTN